MLKCEIISVGTELLLGQIANTDAKFISEMLTSLGIDVYFQTNVGDNKSRLLECLKIASNRSDIIILTGGLGPTMDDLTKETVAEFFGLKLVVDIDTKIKIESYFKKSMREMTQNNYKQALFPEGSKILPNDNGTAPGCIFEKNGKKVVILPGPPSELIPMFNNYVYPFLKSLSNDIIVSRVIKIFGIGESKVETMVSDMLLSKNPTVAPLIGNGFVTLRITAKSDDVQKAKKMIDDIEVSLRKIFGEYIFGVDDDTMESIVLNLLKDKGSTLSTAESCTGGLLSEKITSVPGASEVFKFGAITYSNESKENILGVSGEIIRRHGAVSEETAREMAMNVKNISKTDYGLSITGIAGPSGGTIAKPVGLVYIGLAYKDEIYVKKLISNGNRDKVRLNSAMHALDMLRRHLTGLKIDY
ncbi:competence/damage-inducible protein CinA-like protein [Thermoanaerobacterium thermosaccharolyticum M0795]|uniref:Putative competence-damage inducible protein n=3 Tax=Thermoanaerobacterium thermosaccharolyticum TaxID=1517 RepID=D9TLP4_THETC|nr:competence/damage-inducible protein CinA [Thermoanaerobacterium thermosaccharolyticum DSM 571]AGB18999.1 competence/damage-inducible protein CinA-like protein [Thermoanaerobacterium thermosaccharolyticum M0795]KAA5807716.1 competence/damage-inducible protein A [Thermoanaerobacterium thermosaccharolyticum]OXT07556.1 competence/damage-inducible protein A [Thermoanaerobacterium thermosaccharolyticum]TCW38629.1 nicotinamide-nucleotide amidase [Thermohydrogenium kirishiense]